MQFGCFHLCPKMCLGGTNELVFIFVEQLLRDALATQTEKPFSYSWILILIALVAWMEPEDYQPMAFEEVKVCCGALYQNLWWVEEPSHQTDCSIHF